MANSGYGYSVWWHEDGPSLIRYKGGEVFTFFGDIADWERTPNKDNILNGGGDFVWYDDITEEEAKGIAAQIVRNYRNKNSGK